MAVRNQGLVRNPSSTKIVMKGRYPTKERDSGHLRLEPLADTRHHIIRASSVHASEEIRASAY